MFTLSWQLTLGVLVLVPFFLLPARWMGRRLQQLTREQMQLNADMQASMTEKFNVSGALLVKLFGNLAVEVRDFKTKASRVRDIGVNIAVSSNVLFISLMLIAALATALVYGFGGIYTIAGTVSIGTLLALIGLLGQVYGPLTSLSNVRVEVMTALVSFHRVFEVLDLEPMVKDVEAPREIPQGPLSLDFEGVTFKYPAADDISLASLEGVVRSDLRSSDEPILQDITVSIPAGALVALVGPSGAGKTTMTSLIPRFYDVTSGCIRIGDVDIREVRQQDLRDAIGVVTQDSHLFHDTIRMNLTYAKADATDEDMIVALRQAALGDLFDSLADGLDTVVGDRGHRLSGGEKQRMAIARVLLKSPRIIVLDEATSHLDSESEALIQAAFEQALRGRTAMVIAHRLSTVRNADKILVLDAGRIVDAGTHDELLARGGLYADLYRIQFAD
jgi:ATP-binding cassette subfamily B protein